MHISNTPLLRVKPPQLWLKLVPRPVLGSRMALFGLALRHLLFTNGALGGVSVGVPRFRGRALRTFWETESGWVFNPVHLTAALNGEKMSTLVSTHNSCCEKRPQLPKATVLRKRCWFRGTYDQWMWPLSCLYLLQSLSVLQTLDWRFHFHGQSQVGKRSQLNHYTHCNRVFDITGFNWTITVFKEQ